MLNDTHGALWDINRAAYWSTVTGSHYSRVSFAGPAELPPSHEADLLLMLPPGWR